MKNERENLKAGLYIVATPIGNLRDITLRALDVLEAADVIYCEDTRVTRKLLSAFQIKGRLKSYNDHSDDAQRARVIEDVVEGKVVVLASDAGMPMISDPGYKLARDCAAQGLYVTTLPGANAPLSALQLSGLPSDQFCFLGFLPNKKNARRNFLQGWEDVKGALIAFETAPRLQAALQDIADILGNREVAVVREITKLFEESRRAPVLDLITHYEAEGAPKGEIVIVIAPPMEKQLNIEDAEELIRSALKEMRVKDAAAHVAKQTGLKKSGLYDLALRLSKESD